MTSVLLYAQDGTASRDTVHFESIPSNGDRKVDEVLGAVSQSSIHHPLLSFSTHADLKPKLLPHTHSLFSHHTIPSLSRDSRRASPSPPL